MPSALGRSFKPSRLVTSGFSAGVGVNLGGMTDQTRDPGTAARIARDILEKSTEKRVDAVRSVIAATNTMDDAEQGVKNARDLHGKAWADALASGWSDKDLRATGARAPAKTVAPSRARRTARAATVGGDNKS